MKQKAQYAINLGAQYATARIMSRLRSPEKPPELPGFEGF
jgi:hypothetical protein